MPGVFLSPHNDDETLFGAFTLLRHRPLVVICTYDGEQRAGESRAACGILGCEMEQWPFDEGDWDQVEARMTKLDGLVFAPAFVEHGNSDHNRIANLADNASRYLTYTTYGKQTDGVEVAYEPEWIALKHQALACYPSQYSQPGRAEHFLRDIREYTL